MCFVQQAKSGQLTSNSWIPTCSRNRTFLVSRHKRVVNAIIDGIKSKRVPIPVGRRNNNLPADGKIPDVAYRWDNSRRMVKLGYWM